MSDPLGLFSSEANDPLGLFSQLDKPEETSIWDDAKIGAANIAQTLNTFRGMHEGMMHSLVGNSEKASEQYKGMEDSNKAIMKWANPEGKEQSFSGKLIGMAATLPAQLISFPFNTATTGKTMLDEGESLSRAIGGTLLDAAGNVISVALPGAVGGTIARKAVAGAGINATQDVLTRQGISSLAEKKSTKEKLGPSWESTGLSAILGGGLGPLVPSKSSKAVQKDFDAKLRSALDDTPSVDYGTPIDRNVDPIGWEKRQLEIRNKLDKQEMLSTSNEVNQYPLVDQPLEGRIRSKNEAVLGDWRVDENGIPIKADLSMDVQNAQQPLQRNLWGDELAQKHPQENAMSLPEAIDSMPDLPWKTERDTGIDLLNKGGMGPDGRLDAAILEATPGFKVPRGQRGGVDFGGDFSKGKEFLDKILSRNFSKITLTTNEISEQTKEISPTISKYVNRRDVQELIQDMLEAEKQNDPIKYWQEKLAGVTEAEDPTIGGQMTGRGKIRWGQAKGPKDFIKFNLTKEELADLKEFGDVMIAMKDEFYKQHRKSPEPVYPDPENYTWKSGKPEFFHDKKMENPTYARDYAKFEKQVDEWNKETDEINQKFSDEYGINPYGFDKLTHEYGTPEDFLWDTIFGIAKTVESNIAKEAASSVIKNIKVPKNQRGAIDLGPNNNNTFQAKTKAIENIIKQKLTSPAVTGEQVIQEALASGKDGKGWDRMEAGASITAAKRNSPLIQGVSRIIQRASNLADSHIRDFVFPTEKKLRGLSSEEIVQLAKIMKEEELQNKKLSTTQLADLGLSEKQLLAYEAVREMHKDALAKENEARAAQGKTQITEREAYLSSRWKGDFRRPILDKDGELKWYLAADSKRGLEQQTKALLEKFPDLVPGEDHQVHTRTGGPINPAEMYSEMVDVLGRDDPAVARIKEWAEQQAVNEGRGMLAQEKHFKNKLGIRGFVGDRPSNTLLGNFNPKKEAIDLFQQQIAYAKNSYKWSEMQKASQELKKIFSNEELQKTQENNLAYSREYYRNQLGLNTSRVMKELDDVIRQTGVSPNAVNNAIGTTKGLWISQKLVASAGFIASNIIQAGNILPHLADMMVKYGGNPLSAIPVGISSGLLMAAGHIKIAAGRGGFYHYLAALPKEQAEFMVKAMKYAEDNSVIARSVYDESPISTSFSPASRVAQLAGKTLTAPETLLRSISYMTYVEMLRSSGKFKDPIEIFRLAEERTNISMVDYRQGERAMLFNQLGTVGNLSNTLMTFPINYYQQWNWAAREAGRGNPLPGAVMFATQAYVAGAMGIPGFSDADKLWNGIKGLLAEHAPLMWDKVKGIDLKSIMLNLGNSALYGGLSEQSGISVTTRAAAPAGNEMLAAPIAPYVDFAQQIGNIGGMIANPNAQTAAQAALSVAPSGAQGALEVGPLRNQTSVVNPQTGNRVYKSIRDLSGPGQIERTPEEERLRAFGLKSQREVVERDNAFRVSKLESDSKKVMEQLPGRVYNALKVGDKEKAKDLISLYTKLSGKEMSSQQIENEAIREYTTADQRAKKDSTTIPAMLAIKRLKEIQSESRK